VDVVHLSAESGFLLETEPLKRGRPSSPISDDTAVDKALLTHARVVRNVTIPQRQSIGISSRYSGKSVSWKGCMMRANERRLKAVAVSILLGLSLAMPAAAGTAQSDPVSNIRIDNFGRVNANYYRGAQPAGHDYADLQALGIKTVIDLTEDGEAQEPALVQAQGMKFYRIPMTTHETPSPEKMSQFLTLVNDPALQPVYVHCQGGRHRTGVMTAIYRMTDEGWTADRAFAEMKQYKFGMDFLHPEFKDFVYAYRPAVDRVPALQAVALVKPSPTAGALKAGSQ
jgi:protein tyrosine phosphatase (PTP) superfamily phosphohydrolase (DUF442 family)